MTPISPLKQSPGLPQILHGSKWVRVEDIMAFCRYALVLFFDRSTVAHVKKRLVYILPPDLNRGPKCEHEANARQPTPSPSPHKHHRYQPPTFHPTNLNSFKPFNFPKPLSNVIASHSYTRAPSVVLTIAQNDPVGDLDRQSKLSQFRKSSQLCAYLALEGETFLTRAGLYEPACWTFDDGPCNVRARDLTDLVGKTSS